MMNISSLTTDEILRMYSPETELEKELFSRIVMAEDEVESLRYELLGYENQSCGECDDKDQEIRDLESTEKALRELLDGRDIDHSKIL